MEHRRDNGKEGLNYAAASINQKIGFELPKNTLAD